MPADTERDTRDITTHVIRDIMTHMTHETRDTHDTHDMMTHVTLAWRQAGDVTEVVHLEPGAAAPATQVHGVDIDPDRGSVETVSVSITA